MEKIIVNNQEFLGGCPIEPEDKRDLIWSVPSTPFDWELGFDIELLLGYRQTVTYNEFWGKYGRKGWGIERYREIVNECKEKGIKPFIIPIKNQHRQLSCSGHGQATYVSVLNMIETGEWVEISPRDLYAYTHLANGGAYNRDGMKLIKKRGVATLEAVPITIDGRYMTELEVREKPIESEKLDAIRIAYQAKDYTREPIGETNLDGFAWNILLNFGVVAGVSGENNGTWHNIIPTPPTKRQWGHLMYFGKASLYEKETIWACNSWGNIGLKGWQGLQKEYFDIDVAPYTPAYWRGVYNAWTLEDKINIMKFVKEKNKSDVYLVGQDKKLHPILREYIVNDIFGGWDKITIETVDSINEEDVSYGLGGIVL